MNIPNAIKPANIDIRQYRKGDNLDKLDLTGDESDPLRVDEFFKTKAIAYQDNQLCSIWSVLYDDRIFYINHDCNEKNKITKNRNRGRGTQHVFISCGIAGTDGRRQAIPKHGHRIQHNWICYRIVQTDRE